LTPSLIRIEQSASANAPYAFDDRATLTVVNRQFPVPKFSVSYPNSSSIQVATAVLTVSYVSSNNVVNTSSCTHPLPHTDQASALVSALGYELGKQYVRLMSICDSRLVATVPRSTPTEPL
jgi:hypothetical protein